MLSTPVLTAIACRFSEERRHRFALWSLLFAFAQRTQDREVGDWLLFLWRHSFWKPACISKVQTSTGAQSASATSLGSTGSAVTSGNAVIVYISIGFASIIGSVTDDKGNIYTNLVQSFRSPSLRSYIFGLANITNGPSTVTANIYGLAVSCWIVWEEVSGLGSSLTVDVTGSTNGSGSAPSVSGFITTGSADYIAAIVSVASVSYSTTTPTGYALLYTVNVNTYGNLCGSSDDQITSSPGNYSPSWSVTASAWAAAAVALEASALAIVENHSSFMGRMRKPSFWMQAAQVGFEPAADLTTPPVIEDPINFIGHMVVPKLRRIQFEVSDITGLPVVEQPADFMGKMKMRTNFAKAARALYYTNAVFVPQPTWSFQVNLFWSQTSGSERWGF